MARSDAMRGGVSVRGQACLLRRKVGGCSRCLDICPSGAITSTGSAVCVDTPCLGCGRCAAACPTGAVTVRGFDLAPLLGRAVQIDCSRVPEDRSPRQALRVPCLGGLTLRHLLHLRLSAGAAPLTLLDRGWCAECPAGGMVAPYRDTLDRAATLLSEMGLPETLLPHVHPAPLPARLRQDESAAPAMSRRGLFRLLVEPSAAPAADPYPEALAAAQDRLAVVDLVRQLVARTGGRMPFSLLPRLEIADSCRDHGVCAALCPTAALQREEIDTLRGLSFDAGRCIACGLCAGACPSQFLTLEPVGGSVHRHLLTRHAVITCRRCGADLVGDDGSGLCPGCRTDRRYFTEFLPPGHAAAGNAGRAPVHEEGVSI